MSKKVLKLAGQRPMLLALFIIATLTLGLSLSGWLTPISSRAQPSQNNPPPSNEMVNCVTSSTSTNCSEGTVTFGNVTVNPPVTCVGSGVSASVDPPTIAAGQMIIDMSYTNANPNATNSTCDDTYVTNTFTPNPTYTWIANGPGNFSTNGSGLSASFAPTSCGGGTITFTATWPDSCDTNQGSTSVSGNYTVAAVDSLTPSIPSGLGGLEAGSDPPTYWACTCAGDIIVTASSCPGLTADQLPSCWTFTGGDEIDKLNHKVSAATLKNGPVTFTVTCGTSTQTIILEADKEKENYDVAFPLQSCGVNSFTGSPQCLDSCGNFLNIDCVGVLVNLYGYPTYPGHYSYRYDGIWVGTCYYPNGQNEFLYKTTKHNCRILRTWHLTQQPTSPTLWTVTKYDCMAGGEPSQNCRTAPTWNNDWCRPADELLNKGYPANSCENQGTASSGACPPYNWQ